MKSLGGKNKEEVRIPHYFYLFFYVYYSKDFNARTGRHKHWLVWVKTRINKKNNPRATDHLS